MSPFIIINLFVSIKLIVNLSQSYNNIIDKTLFIKID